MSKSKKSGVTDAASSDDSENPENLKINDEPVAVKLPSRLLVIKNFALSAKMPGQSAAVLTKYFREGQMIYEPEKIKWLLEQNAPVEILS